MWYCSAVNCLRHSASDFVTGKAFALLFDCACDQDTAKAIIRKENKNVLILKLLIVVKLREFCCFRFSANLTFAEPSVKLLVRTYMGIFKQLAEYLYLRK